MERLRHDLPPYNNVRKIIEAKLFSKEELRSKRKSAKIMHLALESVWARSELVKYRKFIDFLEKENLYIESSFISREGEELFWNEELTSDRQYLKAFLYLLSKERLIPEQYSSRQYKAILLNTFKFSNPPYHDVFKNLSS